MSNDRPQWEDCKVCGGDHWTKDHEDRPRHERVGLRYSENPSPSADGPVRALAEAWIAGSCAPCLSGDHGYCLIDTIDPRCVCLCNWSARSLPVERASDLLAAALALDALWDEPDPEDEDAADGKIWLADYEEDGVPVSFADALRALRKALGTPRSGLVDRLSAAPDIDRALLATTPPTAVETEEPMDATATLNAMLAEDGAIVDAIRGLRRDGYNHTCYTGCLAGFPDGARQARDIPADVDCPACQAARRFFRLTQRLAP